MTKTNRNLNVKNNPGLDEQLPIVQTELRDTKAGKVGKSLMYFGAALFLIGIALTMTIILLPLGIPLMILGFICLGVVRGRDMYDIYCPYCGIPKSILPMKKEGRTVIKCGKCKNRMVVEYVKELDKELSDEKLSES